MRRRDACSITVYHASIEAITIASDTRTVSTSPLIVSIDYWLTGLIYLCNGEVDTTSPGVGMAHKC